MDSLALTLIPLSAISAANNYSYLRKILYLLPVAFIFGFLEDRPLVLGHFDMKFFLNLAFMVLFITSMLHPCYSAKHMLKKTIGQRQGRAAIRNCLLREYFLPLFMCLLLTLVAGFHLIFSKKHAELSVVLMAIAAVIFILFKASQRTIRLAQRLKLWEGAHE